ncbi:cellulose synthase/poly-beta-1,6-N-acetylglucosamine synthase-like glycosyltransferase [Hasllibacter halocynthiae]|uniref:Cellulose synthase/poly-beta-1,6-N-acetylglucosamine synthase-like glycosyltransferase n=1 Tax=Hasllibacter halocynthiae TaxID=595589 RepID=A0A2T0X696_9RHOB|nr:glycosyltransferase family 2 protein [Hasllibacter halocynthiae]PRY94468.1 cellulose synthase/poly-beta-1,6-N-acetylglucosamine synthase-like glycosyltransferase [Hasllibacter halocynthiae]
MSVDPDIPGAVAAPAAERPAAPRPSPRAGHRFATSGDAALGAVLTNGGAVAPADLLRARGRAALLGRPLGEVLAAGRMVGGAPLSVARRRFAPPADLPLAPLALDPAGVAEGLAASGRAMPLRASGPVVPVALPHPEDWPRHAAALRAELGPCRPVGASRGALRLARAGGPAEAAARHAERRCPEADSVRSLGAPAVPALALAAATLVALALAPLAVLGGAALALLLAGAVLRGLGLAAALRTAAPARTRAPGPVRITMLVPLLREDRIAQRLMRRIEAVRWPRDALEVLLVHEADDHVTARALAAARLPGWARAVAVPPGGVRTKPRALNYALGEATGAIVGIWDAEDAPEAAQLETVAARFAAAPREVACLQGRLAFYNPRESWLTRAFAADYATWFGLVLPGLARLGLPVPLGGTTLFFRREALEAVGGWDAHNVTEDADLGVRLHRRGWRTEIVDTETLEEAVARPWPWVRQRSRWIKGYALTWAVHARRPRVLWRDLGPAGFAAFHAHFLSGIGVLALMPPLWAAILWRWAATGAAPGPALGGAGALWLGASGVHVAGQVLGAARSGGRARPLWVLAGLLTFPLAVAATWKALWEVAVAPFWWDKTDHGQALPEGAGPI